MNHKQNYWLKSMWKVSHTYSAWLHVDYSTLRLSERGKTALINFPSQRCCYFIITVCRYKKLKSYQIMLYLSIATHDQRFKKSSQTLLILQEPALRLLFIVIFINATTNCPRGHFKRRTIFVGVLQSSY